MDMTPVLNSLPRLSVGWNYAMRRNMQEIIPGLFLGPYSSAQKNCQHSLIEKGITHIICVRQDVEAHFIRPQINDPKFTYLTIEIADKTTENIMRFFPKTRQFIDDAFSKRAKVLIHGNTGTSRSATLVLAYIMEKYGLGIMEAINRVKERRGCIHPNEGFLAQLTEYEPIYKARQTQARGETSKDNQRFKRKREHTVESVDYDLIQPPPSPSSDNNNDDSQQGLDDLSNLYGVWLLKQNS